MFDPAQWNFLIRTLNATTNLPDIPTTATPDSTSGGGFSLAIGRPEFSKFDVNGQRAWQLLDTFALAPRTTTSGLVNVNTASFEALRALAVGILQSQDRAIVPSGLATNFYPPKATARTSSEDTTRTTGRSSQFVRPGLINSRPFLSLGQLQTVTNSIGPFFANPKQWQDQTPPAVGRFRPGECFRRFLI